MAHPQQASVGAPRLALGARASLHTLRQSSGKFKINKPAKSIPEKPHRPIPVEHRAAQPSPIAHRQETTEFFAESGFNELGISGIICRDLELAGFSRPSAVQALAMPPIVQGKSVVLAAETGSGKTLAYLAPLATLLQRRASAEPDSHSRRSRCLALVLVPNAALCQQVLAATALVSGNGLRAAHVSSSLPPPREPPDIVVATPGGLMALLREGDNYGAMWTEEGVGRHVGHVVVDEADMLLTGGFEKDVNRLLDMFKAADRRMSEEEVMEQCGMNREDFSRLNRFLKRACWEGGLPAMLRAGFRPPGVQQGSTTSSVSGEAAAAPEGSQAEAGGAEGEQVQAEAGPSKHEVDLGPTAAAAAAGEQVAVSVPWRRQYVFVAATMPSALRGDTGAALKDRYPDALWLTGDLLHRSQPQVSHSWLHVAPGQWEESLIAAVLGDAASAVRGPVKGGAAPAGADSRRRTLFSSHDSDDSDDSDGAAADARPNGGLANDASGSGPTAGSMMDITIATDDINGVAAASGRVVDGVVSDDSGAGGAAGSGRVGGVSSSGGEQQRSGSVVVGGRRTLVFARDVSAAQRAAQVLRGAGVKLDVYHKGVPMAERVAVLRRAGEWPDSVVVCTDAAARGVDIPRVDHVVQADFAATAVDFLHRIGRTARAGCSGHVTSLYADEDEALVEVLREYIAAGRPVEDCFSSNRSFSKKLKRYGRFVPRGQEAPKESP